MIEITPTILDPKSDLAKCMVNDAKCIYKFLHQALVFNGFSDDDLVKPIGQSTLSVVEAYVDSLKNHLEKCKREHIHIS